MGSHSFADTEIFSKEKIESHKENVKKSNVENLFHRYSRLISSSTVDGSANCDDYKRFPGSILGQWDSAPKSLFFHNWKYRQETYEMLFATKADLAESIYSIALHTKDLDSTVSLSRFKRGAQGFHYSISQVVSWANSFARIPQKSHFAGSERFLSLLIEEKIVIRFSERFRAFGKVSHIIGAAPGIRRSLEKNLNHERWHVTWDHDVLFKNFYISKWCALSESEKESITKSFTGYNQDFESQIIEEWAVKQNEKNPIP
ncbi:hypothetical protein [Desulfamplus magnetovallimortis]|uniref:hypothetical protein n=1 Tax=Desulfamplus magnetovallimortis TaxID=1246637 RepID=UPI001118920D|nr:hypothetical protein [Desulfamplus magnetovallimortis]